MNSNNAAQKLDYTISLASEADLPALVNIQFKVFNFFTPEVLTNGQDAPANHAKVVERHRNEMRTESGLRIFKVETVPDSTATSTNNGKTIIGFCMFCLPNEDANTPLEKIPRSIRPRTAPFEATWIDDPTSRARMERYMTTTHNTVQPVIAGRPCAWVRYMCILPAYQRQGIGYALMERGCQLFDERGINAALQATDSGAKLYRQFGFETVATNYFELDGDEAQDRKKVLETAVMWRNAVTK